MRATTKHLRSEMRGPGVALHIVEHDADDPNGAWEASHEVGWYSYDVVGRIRETLQNALAEYHRPLAPHDIARLRAHIQQVKDKHAQIEHAQIEQSRIAAPPVE